MLEVYRSNRTEKLLAALAALVSEPLPDPFLPETIVVQGKGMERWLSMQLAARLGVWANPSFPFPRSILNRAITAVLGEDPAAARFEPEALRWRIATLLPDLADRKELSPIRSYLEGDERQVRLFQLSARIADVFDRYVIYRPDLIRAWERGDAGEADPWQSILWREIGRGEAPSHLAARLGELIGRLRAGPLDLAGFPPRVSIFGISTLAPLYLEAFAALSSVIDVHLFLLAPSREYMSGTVSKRQAARASRAGQLDLDFHVHRGNPLLASLGKLGKEFQDVLESVSYHEGDADLFVDPAPDPDRASALALLQSDLVNLRDRGMLPGATDPPLRRDGIDESIRIHSCHSPMREVEALHDRLLRCFDEQPGLEPHDVVVLVPAVDDYAPYVDAVFGADRGRPRIPYHIADRGPRAADRVVDAFFRILDSLKGRMTAPEVFDLLGMDVIRGRFGIEANDLDRIREWVGGTGIRWAVDETHREAAGQSPIHENTWRFGFERLFLGLAMPGRDRTLFAGVLPFDDVEGAESDVLGRFAEFCATLFSFRDLAERPRTVAEWETELGRMLSALVLATPSNADQHIRIRKALDAIRERASAAGFDTPISLDAFRVEPERELGESAAPHGFLSRGVTFCAMVPMRSIPFRVVCLLGMNDATFPRWLRPPRFDLTAKRPRPGDRTRRDDDRHLFLEAILSARDRLLVSYIGQSIQDNTTIPPSVVVADLLDALASTFRIDPDFLESRAALIRQIVVRHPLQPFSRVYFETPSDPGIFSYSTSALEAARAGLVPPVPEPPFLGKPLPPARDEPGTLELAELERFLEHPARWFCQRHLGLYFGGDARILADAEPLELDKLEEWRIGERILRRLVAGDDEEAILEAIRASGALPPGELGRRASERILPMARSLSDLARPLIEGEILPPLPIDLPVGGLRLTGFLRGLLRTGQIEWSYSKLGRRSELRFWIRHLVLQRVASASASLPRETVLVGRAEKNGETPRVVRFGPVRDATAILERLIGLWRDAQRAPVPFLAESSRAYAVELRDRGKAAEAAARALSAARDAFHPYRRDGREYGEFQDPYVVKLFGESFLEKEAPVLPGSGNPLLPVFGQIASEVFDPLLDHRVPDG